VHEVQRAEHTVDKLQHVALGEFKFWHRLENFLEVRLHVIHHDEDVVEVFELGGGDDVEDLGGEVVVLHLAELPQDLDLSDDFFGVVVILENVVNVFYGNKFS